MKQLQTKSIPANTQLQIDSSAIRFVSWLNEEIHYHFLYTTYSYPNEYGLFHNFLLSEHPDKSSFFPPHALRRDWQGRMKMPSLADARKNKEVLRSIDFELTVSVPTNHWSSSVKGVFKIINQRARRGLELWCNEYISFLEDFIG